MFFFDKNDAHKKKTKKETKQNKRNENKTNQTKSNEQSVFNMCVCVRIAFYANVHNALQRSQNATSNLTHENAIEAKRKTTNKYGP